MKFSIGDKVLLKRTGEEGVVIALLSGTMMEVAVNGVHFPVYNDEVDHPYLKWFTEQKKAQKKTVSELPVERPRERPARLARGIYLSFMPVYVAEAMEDIVSHIRIYLLNETAAPVHFSYEAVSAGGGKLFFHRGSLHAFGNIYLHSLTLEEMNGQPRFHWLLAASAVQPAADGQKGMLRIKPARLFAQISELQQSGAPSFNYFLAEDASSIPAPAAAWHPPAPETASLPIWPSWQPREVLDLHIEQLTDHYGEMSAAEKLQLQTDALQYELDMAVAHGQRQLTVIHGVGAGVLRETVHRILGSHPHIAGFANDWQGRYGYGATVVTFR